MEGNPTVLLPLLAPEDPDTDGADRWLVRARLRT